MFRVAVVLLALGLAWAPMAAASATSLDRPSWSPGDSWTYASNTTFIPGLNLTGTFTSTLEGRVPTLVGGVSVDAYETLLSATGSASGVVTSKNGSAYVAGTWSLTGEERFEPVNLQMVYYLADLEVNGTANYIYPFTARVQNTTTYEILANDWQYPLAAGTSGQMTIGYNFTLDTYSSIVPHIHLQGVGEWNVTFAVAAAVTVSSPAGSFDAFPVTETWPDGSVDRGYASPQVGNNVRTESYSPRGNLTAVSTLTVYRYQALEPPTFLGLTYLGWAIVVVVAAAGFVAVLWIRRSRRKKTVPPGPPGPDLTSGPRGP